VQGIIRRGLTVESLKAFMVSQGASKNINLMEWDKLWAMNKAKLETTAHRYNAVATQDMVPLELTNLAADEVLEQPLHLKNAAVGTKQVVRSRTVLIEQVDAAAIADGEEITLMNWGNVFCDKIERDADGKVTKVVGRTHPEGDFKTTAKKYTWVGYQDLNELVPMNLVEYGPLIVAKKVEDNMKVEDIVNHDSKVVSAALGEAAMKTMKEGDILQILRKGFYRVDAVPTEDNKSYTMIYVPDGSKRAQPGLSL
jgi:glutamyl-tRNA synthetase